jgi:hypothetical protein
MIRRLKYMIPILLFLAAVVPFIVHLKLTSEMQQRKQQKLNINQSKLLKQGSSTSRIKKPHRLQLDVGIQDDDQFLPRKSGHFWRYPSNKKSLMKFHSIPERKIALSQWNLLMPSSAEAIKLDGITVSLKSGIEENLKVRINYAQESSDDVEESNPEEETDFNADNAASQDETRVLTSETAAWEPDQKCVPMADWQTTFKPTCNSLHEMDMPFLLNKEAYSLVSNKGFWRNAWNVDMNVAENGMSPVSNIVIKSLKYYHEPNDETFELNRVDGVSMEQLTQSRYITEIYGYCGTTSLQEFAGAGNLAKWLPKLKPIEKLGMAAWVAGKLFYS